MDLKTVVTLALMLLTGCGPAPKAKGPSHPPAEIPSQSSPESNGQNPSRPAEEERDLVLTQKDFGLKSSGGLLRYSTLARISPAPIKDRSALKIVVENSDALNFTDVSASIYSYASKPETRFRFRDLDQSVTVTKEKSSHVVQFPMESLLKAMREIEADQGMTECQDLYHELTVGLGNPKITGVNDTTAMIIIQFNRLPRH